MIWMDRIGNFDRILIGYEGKNSRNNGNLVSHTESQYGVVYLLDFFTILDVRTRRTCPLSGALRHPVSKRLPTSISFANQTFQSTAVPSAVYAWKECSTDAESTIVKRWYTQCIIVHLPSSAPIRKNFKTFYSRSLPCLVGQARFRDGRFLCI